MSPASDEQRARWREAKARSRAGQVRQLAPCGTEAGYRRHLRTEGKPVTCAACLAANAQITNERRGR